MGIALDSRPRLRRGVKLTYDHTRKTYLLLYPEGVLVPNATASAVLRLCDGESTVEQITVALGTRFDGVKADDVVTVLTRLADRRMVQWT